MNIEHVPTIAHNPEENGISERINLTIMNAIRAAIKKARIDWTYWVYAIADVVDKYDQIPYSATGKSPHGAWFGEPADLRGLFVFVQYGYVTIMKRKKKTDDRGQNVRYLRRDGASHIIVETEQQQIQRYRAVDFKPYFSNRDPTKMVMPYIQVAMVTNKAEILFPLCTKFLHHAFTITARGARTNRCGYAGFQPKKTLPRLDILPSANGGRDCLNRQIRQIKEDSGRNQIPSRLYQARHFLRSIHITCSSSKTDNKQL